MNIQGAEARWPAGLLASPWFLTTVHEGGFKALFLPMRKPEVGEVKKLAQCPPAS